MCHEEYEPTQRDKIDDGYAPPRDSWPWLAALVNKTDDQFFCGGSLISERFVLTAAHCFQYKEEPEPFELRNVSVYLGRWNLTDKTEENAVLATPDEFIIHPDWNVSETRWNADIAIVKLAENVILSKSIQPVCFWTFHNQPNKENDSGIIVGW